MRNSTEQGVAIAQRLASSGGLNHRTIVRTLSGNEDFTTVTLMFAGLAIVVGLMYIDVSHRSANASLLVTPADIAATYYGPGVSIPTLIDLAHIHMLGLLTVFWIIGFIFNHSSFVPALKLTLSSLPFLAFVLDVSGWFLTKLTPSLVYVVIIGGGLFIASLCLMIVLSLYDMWISGLFRHQAVENRPPSSGFETRADAQRL